MISTKHHNFANAPTVYNVLRYVMLFCYGKIRTKCKELSPVDSFNEWTGCRLWHTGVSLKRLF